MSDTPREEYHLTPQNGNIQSDVVLLNGTPLKLTASSDDIPDLQPELVDPFELVSVAPLSIVFATLGGLKAPACGLQLCLPPSLTPSLTSEKVPNFLSLSSEKAGGLVPILKKKLSFAEAIASSPPQNELPEEKTIGPLLPSIKKTPTSATKSLDRPPSQKPEPSEPKQPQLQPADATRKSPTKPGQEEDSSTADSWEKTKLHKIKEKFEKLNTTILEWENKKKKKAKRKLEKKEAELDTRRAKAMEHYRNELARVDSIAGGVRSKAIENRTNEEFKVKEKANKIRLTGKVPATCLCC